MNRIPGKISGRGVLGKVFVAVALSSVVLIVTASAQQEEDAKALSLTPGEVKRLRQQAEESAHLDQELKAKILETYDKALVQLEAAEDWSNKAAAFDKLREEAPEATKALEKALQEDLSESMPELPEDASLDQLEQGLMEAKLDQEAVNEQLAQLESEVTRRRERRKKVPELLAAARHRLLEARQEGPKETGVGSSELLKAQKTLVEATAIASEAEIAALRREIPSYEARKKLLTLRLDQALRLQAVKEKEAALWQEKVRERRREEAERAARESREALLEVTDVSPEVRQFAEQLASENAKLADQRTGPEGLLQKIEQTSTRIGETNELLKKVRADFASVEKRVEAGRLSAAIGVMLRQRRADLPEVKGRQDDIRARRKEIENAQLKIIEFREQRLAVSDVQGIVSEKMSGVDPSLHEYQRRRMERLLKELLWSKRSSLQSLIDDYTTYFEKLIELDTAERALVGSVQDFSNFIDERILWVRSARPLIDRNLQAVLPAVSGTVSPQNWVQVIRALRDDVSEKPAVYFLIVFLLVGMPSGRSRIIARLRTVGEEVGNPRCIHFGLTLEALLLTLLTAVLLPAVVWFLGWRIRASGGSAGFSDAIGFAFQFTAILYLTLEIPRQVFRPDGLGRIHFGWAGDRLDEMYKLLGRSLAFVLPSVFVIAAVERMGDEVLKTTLGRITFCFLMFAVGIFLRRMLRSALPGRNGSEASQSGWGWARSAQFWSWLVLGVPVTIAVVSLLGYHYAALQLGLRLHATASLIIAVAILQGMILRWLLLARRRAEIVENRKHREASENRVPGEEAAATQAPEEEFDLAKMEWQTNRLLRGILFFILAIGIWLIWVDVVTAFGILREVDLWHTTQEVSQTVTDAEGKTMVQTVQRFRAVTLADLLLAFAVLAMTFLATRNLPGILQVVLARRFGLGTGERHAVTTIVQYTIAMIGAGIIFKIIGVSWGNIQWLVAALGVGIGFGLQEIVANFISGLILLFERPIRVGDAVTVGDVSGTVSRIRIRATFITTWDRKELIVPNKEFVTGRLVNWTLSDTVVRVLVPVGIAYGSDTEKAKELMLRIARQNDKVLDDPPPNVLFMGFGSSSLDFELRAFTKMDTYLALRDELHMAVDKAFREAGIVIAFPQQDVHLRSVEEVLPIKTGESDAKPG